MREHLRACAGCRATMRAYRATPGAAAALAPVLPARSLLERIQDLGAADPVAAPARRRRRGDSAISQVAAAGGTRGAGMAALAKLLTVCAGAAGGAAACVAAGITPAPCSPHHERRFQRSSVSRRPRSRTLRPGRVETAPPQVSEPEPPNPHARRRRGKGSIRNPPPHRHPASPGSRNVSRGGRIHPAAAAGARAQRRRILDPEQRQRRRGVWAMRARLSLLVAMTALGLVGPGAAGSAWAGAPCPGRPRGRGR